VQYPRHLIVKNLREVIHKKERPQWVDRPFNNLVDYWRKRWAIPRAERMPEWENFKSEKFFNKTESILKELK